MEKSEESSKDRGNGRPSFDEQSSSRRRRPDEDLPLAMQPRDKVSRKNSSESFIRSNRSPDPRSSSQSSPGKASNSRDDGHSRDIKPENIKIEPSSSSSSVAGSRGGRIDNRNRGAGDGDVIDRRIQRYQIIQSRPESANTKKGKTGRDIKLQTNYFRLLKRPEWSIYQYRVDFAPTIELCGLRKGILSEHKAMLGGYLFDGAQLYTTSKLKNDLIELKTKSKMGDEYQITIKYCAKVTQMEWQSLQILNLILRRSMEGLNLQLLGRNFYDAMEMINLREHRLQLWPGYVTSIRQHESDVLVCVDVTHKVMRNETLYDIMQKCINESRYAKTDWQNLFSSKVIGAIVLTDYNNKTYRVDSVDYGFNPQMTFNMKGKDIKFIDYFQQKYKIRIRDGQQPLLLSKPTERQKRGGEQTEIRLVPELCRPTGLTEDMRKDMKLGNALKQYTKSNPMRRIEKLRSFNSRLSSTNASQQVLKDWNMKLDKELVELRGRTVEQEKLLFYAGDPNMPRERSKYQADHNAEWTNFYRSHKMFTQAKLNNWILIMPFKMQYSAREFVQNLKRASQGLGMEIQSPKREITMTDDRNHSYDAALSKAANEDPQLILCLVPNKTVDRYTTIKKFCCTRRAIPSQVVCQSNISKPRSALSIATKIVIQLNAKLGGAPWMVSVPLSGLMVIGYDICRSTKDKSKAYAALVATMDQQISTRYFSTAAECNASDSLGNTFITMVTMALRAYHDEHKQLPKRIILYRDSVGDGSLANVIEHEVKELVKKMEKMYKDSEHPLQFTFIVVSKQINTRFFANNNNPPPGTFIDDTVTLPERYDFYLVAQSVKVGTVSPTNFNVLYDTSQLSPDRIQLLTYKLCHLYYNWCGTTRVPAVCQYAQKLATLVATFLHQVPNSHTLERQLYYL